MKKFWKILLIVVILVYGIYMIYSGVTKIMGAKKNTVNNNTVVTSAGGFVVCGTLENQSKDPSCFVSNFTACTRATQEMLGNDGTTKIVLTIFGMENGKCHYKMDVAGHGADCLFNKADLDTKLIDQIFGNDVGKKAIVEEACKAY